MFNSFVSVFLGCSTDSVSKDESFPKGENAKKEKDSDKKSIMIETKLAKSIEMATQKCSQTRDNGLHKILSTLVTVYKPELFVSFRTNILDIVKKALRHGNGEEQSIGAQIVPMLILQIDNGEEVMKTMAPLLTLAMLDNTIPSSVRTKCCSALALAQCLVDAHSDNTLQLMQQLETIFRKCFIMNNTTDEESDLHRTALNAWGLLLTRIPSAAVVKLFNRGALVL